MEDIRTNDIYVDDTMANGEVAVCETNTDSQKTKGVGKILAGIGVAAGAVVVLVHKSKAKRKERKLQKAKELVKENGYGIYPMAEVEFDEGPCDAEVIEQ